MKKFDIFSLTSKNLLVVYAYLKRINLQVSKTMDKVNNQDNTSSNSNEQETLKTKFKGQIYTTSLMHSQLLLADLDEILENSNVLLFSKQKIDYLKSSMRALAEVNIGSFELILKKL